MRFHIQALCFTLCTAGAAGFAGAAQTLSKQGFEQARTDLRNAYKADREACVPLTGNAKDICAETAKAREKVALAHLQVQHTGSESDMRKLLEARYDASYEIGKEVCDDKSSAEKDACVAQVRAERDKAKADLKLTKKVTEAREEALEDRAKADYKAARERCDTLAGENKDVCLAGARARFGQ